MSCHIIGLDKYILPTILKKKTDLVLVDYLSEDEVEKAGHRHDGRDNLPPREKKKKATKAERKKPWLRWRPGPLYLFCQTLSFFIPSLLVALGLDKH